MSVSVSVRNRMQLFKMFGFITPCNDLCTHPAAPLCFPFLQFLLCTWKSGYVNAQQRNCRFSRRINQGESHFSNPLTRSQYPSFLFTGQLMRKNDLRECKSSGGLFIRYL